jgi:hypothetical protein
MIPFLKKMAGGGQRPPKVNLNEVFWSWLGAFLGIIPVAYLNYNLLSGSDFVYIIGSFGASAVLVYGAVRSPLAQPRNLIGGHLLSAFVGVACWQLFHPFPWFAAAFSVATAIALMHVTQTLHPPRWGHGTDRCDRQRENTRIGLLVHARSCRVWCSNHADRRFGYQQYGKQKKVSGVLVLTSIFWFARFSGGFAPSPRADSPS